MDAALFLSFALPPLSIFLARAEEEEEEEEEARGEGQGIKRNFRPEGQI